MKSPAVALLVALAVPLGGCPEKERNAPAPALGKLTSQIEAFTRRLHLLRAKTPAANRDLAGEACPDERIEKATGGAPAPLLIVDYDALERHERGQPFAEAPGSWKVLTAPQLQAVLRSARVTDAKQATDVVLAIQKLEQEFAWVGILRTSERELPRREGEKFHGGKLDGWLHIYELARGEAVCRVHVQAESSAEVAGLSGSNPEETLANDFRANLRRAIADAVRSISRLFREELG
jgi:hypothetical protein